ncbi:MAG: ABC transporter permease [Acidimicrobiales bacterium]
MGMPAALRVTEYRLVAYRRVWHGSALVTFVNPVLFLLAMGLGVGSLVDANDPNSLAGQEYVTFLAPGLLAATAMQVGSTEATWPIMSSIKWVPVAFAQVATPMSPGHIAVGQLVFIGMRLAMSAIAFAVVMALFGVVGSWWVVAAVPAAILTGLAFNAPIMAWSVTLDRASLYPLLQRFVIMPMFLFSGTFFPVAQLPAVVRPIAYVTPLWHGVRLCRTLTLGTADPLEALGHASLLVAIATTGLAVAVRNYDRRLRP